MQKKEGWQLMQSAIFQNRKLCFYKEFCSAFVVRLSTNRCEMSLVVRKAVFGGFDMVPHYSHRRRIQA